MPEDPVPVPKPASDATVRGLRHLGLAAGSAALVAIVTYLGSPDGAATLASIPKIVAWVPLISALASAALHYLQHRQD